MILILKLNLPCDIINIKFRIYSDYTYTCTWMFVVIFEI